MSEWLPSSHLRAIPRVVDRVDQVRSFILQGTFLFQPPPSSEKARHDTTSEIEDEKWPDRYGKYKREGGYTENEKKSNKTVEYV